MGSHENFQENLKKVARTAKKLLKNPVTRNAIIVICAILAIIVLCGAAYDTLVEAFSDAISEQVKKSPAVSYSSTDGSIELEEQGIDDLIKVIKDMGIDLIDLNLSKDDVKKLYMAEVVSSEINRNVTETAGKYYGRVFIKKQNSSGQFEALTYEPLESFEKMDATQILNYFSIEDDKICIASINSSTDENGNEVRTPTINKISYKDSISQYTVPVEFLLNLCFITQNSGFVLEFADKIINETEIVIEVLQEQTVTNITETTTYKEETETSTQTKKYDSAGNYISTSINTPDPTVTGPHTATETQSQTTIRSSLKIRSVKNWIVEEEHTYNKTTNTNTNEVGPIEIDDEEKGTHSYKNETREDLDDGGYNLNSTSTIKRKIDQTQTVRTETTSDTYQEGVSEGIKDKVDEFVGMLKQPYTQKNSGAKRSAIANLENGAEMFFKMLQNGSRTQGLEELMRYILGRATGNNYGVDEFDFTAFNIKEFISVGGNLSAFGTSLTREEFIATATSYSGSNSYKQNIIPYLGDFYDVCTSYNVNPALALAHSCLETGYGNSIPRNNYFGMAVYNGENSGTAYNTPAESIEDYCKWVVNNATLGSSAYNANMERASEYGKVNSKLNGTPDTNIYVLYSRYAYLGNTHLCDEPDFSNPKGTEYYKSHGSTWGAGGRIYIYEMYENGGLYTGEYATRCNHKNATDPTTTEERADYVVYTVEKRANIAKNIFGPSIFVGSFEGETVTAGGVVYPHYFQRDYVGAYGTSTIKASGCGPTSLAMILAGLKVDASINPQTVVDNINNYWPSGSYYVPNVGSSHCIFGSDFLQKYYGVTSRRVTSDADALNALENGYPIIGGEKGHILAIIPAPEEYKAQGYKFYILDSARGHDGPYKTISDADRVVDNKLRFNFIIMP